MKIMGMERTVKEVQTYVLPKAGRPYAHPQRNGQQEKLGNIFFAQFVADATVACLKAIEVAEGAGKGGAK